MSEGVCIGPCLTILSDPTDELLTIIGVFNHFFGVETTIEERQFFKKLAALIGTRAARLSACGIAAIVSKMGYLEKGCSVAADGSLYGVSRVLSAVEMIEVTRVFSEIPELWKPRPSSA